MNYLISLAAVLLCGVPLGAQTLLPERTVRANVITSRHDPAIRIELPKPVRYAGADRWILYAVADCEIHVFVEADGASNVRRFFWIQFEGFVPSRPELQHNYPAQPVTKLDGIEFFVKAGARSNDQVPKAGSDLEHVLKLIAAKGYKLPAGMMTVRFVNLLDAQRRKELMIIYGEDVAPTGWAAADLFPGGKAFPRWPGIEKDLIHRAEKSLRFRRTDAR